MVFVAVLLPNLMLVAVLALGRYEEFMLGRGDPAAEPGERHLTAVPDLPSGEAARTPRKRPAVRRRHAA
ncbi:hypothetical protein ACFYZ9_26380 [Streptomyces sp. NPDC001691]|uniref:hypothetical protein n=1 Tax=unclassified Streptomyces TaxID=2593676 RepID=UPI000DE8E6E1|nr:hypothetical protein [Streptomyces sp. SDr-06]RCH67367.1 hypothetical protein DT019_17195 [Streptomyces sp. SDr-06]